VKRLERIFAAGGPLAGRLEFFRRRPTQVEMARAVRAVIDGGGVLLAEAGTGTGKTLAYLVPAVLSGLRTVVSTGTRNLQEQIFFKDLGLLEEALGLRIEAACLKGQDNYLCRRRAAAFLASPRALAHPASKVAALVEWSRTTVTGDRMELSAIGDDDSLWTEVCSTRETRLGATCPFGEECFVTAARRAAAEARLIVVNHHLYFADRAVRRAGGGILPGHEVLILDEAHLVEDVATEFFSTRVSTGRVDRLLDDTVRLRADLPAEDVAAAAFRERDLEAARALASSLFAALAGPAGRRSFDPLAAGIAEDPVRLRLDAALDAIEQSLRKFEGQRPEIDRLAERHAELRRDLAVVLDRPAPAHVHWVETKRRTVIAGASPIDVSELIRDEVFFAVPTVVLTSATLSTGGNFSYLRSRLGIDFDAAELSLAAPFDFGVQARLYVPSHLGDPRADGYVALAAREIGELVRLTGGGALILCTSIRNMHEIHAALAGRFDGTLLLQGSAPKSLLLDRFRRDGSAVLVATGSFWQGVDVPGDALRMVVIDKLPFASPGDPVVAARIEDLRSRGGEPFREYQLPQAALALKQGFGRLIRTDGDRGIVAVLDRRLASASYRRVLLDSLPPCPVLGSFEQVVSWWTRDERGPAPGTSAPSG
jgi:ATP-dependent DNA helicase DinG